MLARALAWYLGAVACLVIGGLVLVVLALPNRCADTGYLLPQSLPMPANTVQPFNCASDGYLVDADHRYWTADANTAAWPPAQNDLARIDCGNGGLLEIPNDHDATPPVIPPPFIAYRVKAPASVQLVLDDDPIHPPAVSRPVPVGSVSPDLCSPGPNGSTVPDLADFDGHHWRLPDDAPPGVAGGGPCGRGGQFTTTAQGVTYTLRVEQDVLLERAGIPPLDPAGVLPLQGSILMRPVPCGSSAAGVTYDGSLYTPAPGMHFPPGLAPDCTRNGTMILDSTGHLDVYTPDGEHVRLNAYRGPPPKAPCE